jgi:hypothetical protein
MNTDNFFGFIGVHLCSSVVTFVFPYPNRFALTVNGIVITRPERSN